MKLYVNVKQVGSRKNYINKEEIILDYKPSNLRELIRIIVTKNVNEFNENIKKERLIEYLTDEEINNKIALGKVSFGEIHNDTTQNLEKALKVAYLAYEDGIYKVFVGEKEVNSLDESLELKEEEILTFIKLTMLSGRMW